MMAALLKYQGKDGMWRQLIDHDEAWPESSSSAMFTFALITGVKYGWARPAKLRPCRAQGMDRRCRLHRSEPEHNQRLPGHGQEKRLRILHGTKTQITGDFHGQAPVLWAASALLR